MNAACQISVLEHTHVTTHCSIKDAQTFLIKCSLNPVCEEHPSAIQGSWLLLGLLCDQQNPKGVCEKCLMVQWQQSEPKVTGLTLSPGSADWFKNCRLD